MYPFRLVIGLLTKEDRRRILSLIPAMLLSSLFDLGIVGGSAAYFAALTNRKLLTDDGVIGTLFQRAGVDERSFLLWGGVGVFLLVFVGNLVSAFTTRAVFRFSWSQITSIGERTLGSYLYRPYAFFLTRSTPELGHQVLVEVQGIVDKVIVQACQSVARSFGALLVAAWLFVREPLLTLALVGTLGLAYSVAYLYIRRRLLRLGTERSSTNKRRHAVANESLLCIKEIKLHGLESEALQRFAVPSRAFSDIMSSEATLSSMPRYSLETIAVGGLVLVVVYMLASNRPVEGALGIVGTYAIAAYRLLPALQTLFGTASHIRFETPALESIHRDVAAAPRLTPVQPSAVPFEQTIELVDVTYRYPNSERPVLDRMSLRLERGSWSAFVGSTGSGKTTLVDLVMGLLQPENGEVRVDGRPIRTAGDLVGWQSHIGYVPQAMFMSDDTVAANIAFGDKTPDRARVREAAQLATLADFVESEMPQGYDTPVGERGIRLSGGQRQRIGIARAIYRQPDLLVLDEATSALDNRTEALFMERLRAAHALTTVIMIAHRLSTTRYCDQIFLLDHGRIVDRGTYDELLQRSSRFQDMVAATSGGTAGNAASPG